MTFSKEDQALLVEKIKLGDMKALNTVYEKHFNMIYRLVKNNSGSYDDAKDIYQEGMLDVYENIVGGKYKHDTSISISTYIYSVCRNKWMKELRNRIKRPFLLKDEFTEWIDIEIPDEEPSIPYQSWLERALEKIGEKCKKMLTGFYYQRKPMEQLAIELNYSSANVAKSSKERCMKRAKEIASTYVEKFSNN